MNTEKRILLCALNSKFIHSCLAVHSIKKYAVTHGCVAENIKICEFTVNDTLDFILNGIFKEKADIIAFSVYIWNCEYISKLCKIIKKASPNTTVVLGGPEVSYTDKHPLFSESDFDFIIRGEGEKSFYNFIKTGEVINERIENIDEIPFAYDENNISLFENRIVYYETSRGCPFSCAYCLSSAEKSVRFLSFERVKNELTFFAKHNVHQVKFVDRTFNADKKRAYEIWKYIIETFKDKNINFHFEIAADLLRKEDIEILSSAPDGLIQLEIGIQSTKDETLNLSCRKTNTEKVLANTQKLIDNANINIHTDLIAGLPGESIDDFLKSFDDVYKLKSHQLQLGFLKLLHGTEMENISKNFDFSFSPYPPYEIIKNRDLSLEDILFLKKFEDTFEKIYNSQRFILTVNELEKYFDKPSEMFKKITDYFSNNYLSFVSVSTKEIYNLLHRFFKENISNDTLSFDKILLCDYYFSEKSELVPTELSYLIPLQKDAREKSSKILHSLNLQKQKGLIVRFIESDTYIVDYSKRNKITSRFSYEIWSM